MNLLKAKAQASWLKKMSQVLWITEENWTNEDNENKGLKLAKRGKNKINK